MIPQTVRALETRPAAHEAREIGHRALLVIGDHCIEAGIGFASRTPKLKLVFGTDAVAGAHGRNAEELVCRVRNGGQSAMDAIVSATSRAAESVGLEKQIGRIAEGFIADIIATDGDPSQQIEATQRVTFVMRDGKVYRNDGAPLPSMDKGEKGVKGKK